MNDEDVAFAGVARQAELVRTGQVSSRELTELALSRIERYDPELNAFVAVHAEEALAQARDHPDGPLAGVPIAVKDELDIKGRATSRGTGAFKTPAPDDCEAVKRLRRAGAVIVGKTTMPELGLWPFTESITWGVTRNPWNTDRTPGGSSGGSAAAVAAGLVGAAIGADGAGSIRIPAACTGLYGLKPHTGRISRAPHDRDGNHWICFGALTRSVADSVLMLDVLADAALDPPKPPRLRIGYVDAFPPGTRGKLTADVREALEDMAHACEEHGHTVVPAKLDLGFADVLTLVTLMFRGIRDLVHESELPHRLERRTRAIARPGRLVPDALVERLLERERAIARKVQRVFDAHDALLMPVMSAPAVPAQLMEGRGAIATYAWETGWVPFNVLWNSTGQPAAAVPAGFSADGLPLSVQVVGRPHDEQTVLALSAMLEAARPWTHHRPTL